MLLGKIFILKNKAKKKDSKKKRKEGRKKDSNLDSQKCPYPNPQNL